MRYISLPDMSQYVWSAQTYLISPGFLWQLLAMVCVLSSATVTFYWIKIAFLQLTRAYSRNKRMIKWYNYLRVVKVPLLLVGLLSVSILVFQVAELPDEALESVLLVCTAWLAIKTARLGVQSRFLLLGIRIFVISLVIIHFLGISQAVVSLLDNIAFYWQEKKISLYMVLKTCLLITVLFWSTFFVSKLFDKSIKRSKSLTPSMKLLLSKIIKITLLTLAFLGGLNLVGLDLTVFAIFSGAFGLGVGFGLQKIISNFISGLILLSDKSIKPGDVIGIGNTYGWVNALGARYVSVITRDGKEHLIPNEQLITEKVENWSFTNNDVRLRIPMRISYESDIHQALRLILEVAHHIPRILNNPQPKCLVRAFGDFAIDLELRVWIDDPANGMGSVQSEVLLGVLDKFKEHGIKIPYPRYDVVKN